MKVFGLVSGLVVALVVGGMVIVTIEVSGGVAEQAASQNVRVYAIGHGASEAKWSQALQMPLITVPFASRPPRLDGQVSEGEWCESALFTGFSDLTGKRARRQTQVFACWDGQNLYFGFRSNKRYESGLREAKRDTDVFSRDAIEINLFPSNSPEGRWFKFAFDAAGTQWDAIFRGSQMVDQAWNPDWTVKNRLIHDAFFVTDVWEAEAAIPFTAMGVQPPREGERWAVQVCRDFDELQKLGYPVSERWTSWSPALQGGFNNPNTFGTFLFAQAGRFVRIAEVGGIADGVLRMAGVVGLEAASKAKGTMKVTRENLQGELLADKHQMFSVPASGKVDFALETELDLCEVTDVAVRWELTDAAGNPLMSLALVEEIAPSFAIKYIPLPIMGKVLVEGDLSRMKGVPAGLRVVTELRNAPEGQVLVKDVIPLKGQRIFLSTLQFGDIEAGEYTVSARLESADGKVVKAGERTLTIAPKPDWTRVHAGQLTRVPKPWTPVHVLQQADGVTVSTWAKEYRFGKNPLVEAIRIRGSDFLVRPARLVIKKGGRKHTLKYSSPAVRDVSEVGATLTWAGTGSMVRVSNRARVEFDGLIWNTLFVAPAKEPTSIDEIYIELPVNPRWLRYVRGVDARDFMHYRAYLALLGKARFPNPNGKPVFVSAEAAEFSTDGWMWQEVFLNYLWIGAVDRELFTIFNSPRNMVIARRYNDIVEQPHVTLVRLYLIQGGAKLDRGVKYDFGLMATPTRPIRDRDLMNRTGANCISSLEADYYQRYLQRLVYWGGHLQLLPEGQMPAPEESVGLNKFFVGPKIEVKKGDLYTSVFNVGVLVSHGNPYPTPEQLKKIDNQTKPIRSLGMKPILWLDIGYTPITLKQAEPYQFEWEQYPPQRTNFEGEECTLVCPKGSWKDYYLYGVERLMKEHDIEGFYLDMSGPGGCANRYHGCGYEKDGKVQREIPFLDYRDLYLRLYNLVHTNKPDGVIIHHSALDTPVVLYVDLVTKGEGWTAESDYQKLTLPYYQVAYMTHYQYGVQHNFFSVQNYLYYRRSLETVASLWEVVGMSLVHDMLPYPVVSESIPGLVTVWNALRDFRAYDVDTRWVPYWDSGIGDWQKGIAASYYRRKDGVFLVLFNAQFDGDKEVTIDLRKLWRPGAAHITNVLTGEVQSAEGTLRRTIKPRKVELLILR